MLLWHHCKLWFSTSTCWLWKLTFAKFVTLTGFWMGSSSDGWWHHSFDWHFLVERCLLMCLNEKSLGPFASPLKGNVSQRKLKTKLTCVLNIVSTTYASSYWIWRNLYILGKFSDTFVCVPRKVKRITLLEELLSLFKRIE